MSDKHLSRLEDVTVDSTHILKVRLRFTSDSLANAWKSRLLSKSLLMSIENEIEKVIVMGEGRERREQPTSLLPNHLDYYVHQDQLRLSSTHTTFNSI